MADTHDGLAASARMNIAARMILAYLDDADAWDGVAAEVGPCLDCWTRIARHLTRFAADEMTENMGHDNALAYIQALVTGALDIAERHEHDGGNGA